MKIPQIIIRDVEDPFPERRVIMILEPLRTEVFVEETIYFRRYPGRGMNPIGDGSNGNFILNFLRPDRSPHSARDDAMHLADPVAIVRKTQAERGHIKVLPPVTVIMLT